MKNKIAKFLAWCMALVLSVVLLCSPALAAASLPNLPKDKYVVDDAGVLSAKTETFFNQLNGQLENKCSGAQIALLTVQYTGNTSTEDYALQAFNKWGVGSKNKNNGVLILLVMESPNYADGDYYITLGDGFRKTTLEKQVSDIAQYSMEAAFSVQNYDLAATKGAQAIADTIAEIYGVSLEEAGSVVAKPGTGAQKVPGGYAVPEDKQTLGSALLDGIVSTILIAIFFLIMARMFFSMMGSCFGRSLCWGFMPFGLFSGWFRPRYHHRHYYNRGPRGPRPPRGGGFGGGFGGGMGGGYGGGFGGGRGGGFHGGGMGGGHSHGGGGGRGR